MKTNLKFIFDIIDSNIKEYEQELVDAEKDYNVNQHLYSKGKIVALESFRDTLKKFIDEANKL